MINQDNLYLSTIAPQAPDLAREYGLGLEIAETCTAMFMDDPASPALLEGKLQGVSRRVLHGPFNELFPCAIDPKARELAKLRFTQAMDWAVRYGADKLILHSGYNPNIYYDIWFEEQSILFWREFAKTIPAGLTVCVENVLETDPEPLLNVIRAVDHPRLRICLDVGHANCYSNRPVGEWIDLYAPWISHFHLHNNFGDRDTHSDLNDGSMDRKTLLAQIGKQCPEATLTLEIPDPRQDIRWLLEGEA